MGQTTITIDWRATKLCAAIVMTMSIHFALFVDPAYAGRLEAGTFVAHDTFGANTGPEFVAFQEPFDGNYILK